MTNQDNSTTPQDELKQDVPQSSLSRRHFLTVSSAVIASLAIPGHANADSTPLSEPSSPVPAELLSVVPPAGSTIVVPPIGSPFVQPMCILSEKGLLQTDFIAQNMKLSFNTKSDIDLWSYNGQFPGPTLYANPGDAIDITLRNQLPPNPEPEKCEELEMDNKPNCFNTTNLHFHGFHVSPSSKKNGNEIIFSSDDSLIAIEPGETHKYYVKLPDYHAPGTHWYHPHRHGSTAKQMAPGMAGAIIIKEPSQEENIVAESEDKVWLIQEVNTKAADIYNPRIRSGTTSDFLVNGIHRPSISMQTGKMQRWRFLNGCVTPSGFLRLKLCKHSNDPAAPADLEDTIDGDAYPMYLIAADGISFYGKEPKIYSTKEKTKEAYKVAPGNRADFLILLNEPGTYKLVTQQYPPLIEGGESEVLATRDEVLAYVRVEASLNKIAWDRIPEKIPGDVSQYPYLAAITDKIVNKNPQDSVETDPLPHKKRELIFTAAPGERGKQKPEFKINGKRFHDDDTTYIVKVNEAEEWVLDNIVPLDQPRGRVAPHPFHIHVNPFQVVAEGTKNGDQTTWKVIPEADRIWHDTIAVEANKPLKIWHRFATYPGKFVLHCHILIHEDQGMMYSVEVEGEGPGPGEAVHRIA